MSAAASSSAAPAAAPPTAAIAAPAVDEEFDCDDAGTLPSSKMRGRKKQVSAPAVYLRSPLSADKCSAKHLKSTAAPPSEEGAAARGAAPVRLTSLAESQDRSRNKLVAEKWRDMGKSLLRTQQPRRTRTWLTQRLQSHPLRQALHR